ncbi:MAG: lipoyl(octanoyl) transferase LipB, partial [Thermodesulfobacteriota bacterium]
MNTLDIYHLGEISYKKALDIQFKLLEKRINNEINDSLLLLEHPPTITIGRNGNRSNLLISDSYLSENNIEYFEINRGGDITFHGPGQIVCYPIIDLNNHTKDVHKYL